MDPRAAIIPECAMCRVPLEVCHVGKGDIFPKQLTGECHFCSDPCRNFAESVGWSKESTESPRDKFHKKFSSEVPKCDICGEDSKMKHTSGICWNCKTVVCGRCTYGRDDVCQKCGVSMSDEDGLREAYEFTDDIHQVRIFARLISSVLRRKKDPGYDLFLKISSELGDLQSYYSKILDLGKPTKDDTEIINAYFYLAILDHPGGQCSVAKLWEGDLVPGGVDKGWETKRNFWYESGARNGDRIACYGLANIYKKDDDTPMFLHWMKRSAELGYEQAYHELGCHWRDLGRNDLAGENFDKGSLIQAGLCSVQYGIGMASGMYDIPKNIKNGKYIIEKIYSIGKIAKKGSSISVAHKMARDWLAASYYNDERVAPICEGFPQDREKAIELLEEGINDDDPVCMLVMSKIFSIRGDKKTALKFIKMAQGV